MEHHPQKPVKYYELTSFLSFCFAIFTIGATRDILPAAESAAELSLLSDSDREFRISLSVLTLNSFHYNM